MPSLVCTGGKQGPQHTATGLWEGRRQAQHSTVAKEARGHDPKRSRDNNGTSRDIKGPIMLNRRSDTVTHKCAGTQARAINALFSPREGRALNPESPNSSGEHHCP